MTPQVRSRETPLFHMKKDAHGAHKGLTIAHYAHTSTCGRRKETGSWTSTTTPSTILAKTRTDAPTPAATNSNAQASPTAAMTRATTVRAAATASIAAWTGTADGPLPPLLPRASLPPLPGAGGDRGGECSGDLQSWA